MRWMIVSALVSLWLLGLATGYTMGDFTHILLVIAVILVMLRVTQVRKTVEKKPYVL